MSYTTTARIPTIKRDLDCKSTGVLVAGAPVQIVSLIVSNTTATAAYFKVYDKATAPASTDTPIKTILLPANSNTVIVQPRQMVDGEPSTFQFTLGFGYRSVTGVADADTTAPAANGTVLNCEYY